MYLRFPLIYPISETFFEVIGGIDARLWRYEGIPSYVSGPYALSMVSSNEYVEVDEFIDVVKIHVLSAYDYLRHTR